MAIREKYSRKFKLIVLYSQQDLLFNTTNGGYIGQRMKNQRTAEKKRSSSDALGDFSDSNSYTESSEDEMCSDETSLDNTGAKESFEDLKCMVVNDGNRREIENKLRRSRVFRHNLLTVKETDLLECFPYFFADPKLVTHTFDDS